MRTVWSESGVEDLVAAAADGDREAFDELRRRFHPRVMNFLKKRMGNREAAQDVSQEVWLRVWKYLSGYDDGRPFEPWMWMIASNEAKRYHGKNEKRRNQKSSLDKLIARVGPSGMPQDPEDHYFEALTRLREDQITAAMDECELPDDQREVVCLRVYQGLTYREISEITGEPLSTWLSRMRYAARNILTVMREEDDFGT